MNKTKILIDCDPGHDDAVAILFAARHLDLVGITTVHGNNSVENTTHNALALLDLADLDVPLAKGCAEPLAQPRVGPAEVHGKSGLDGATFPRPGGGRSMRTPSTSSLTRQTVTGANWSWQQLVPKPTWPSR
jgi:inosine-uridine nucleoside N-ribohydrolase